VEKGIHRRGTEYAEIFYFKPSLLRDLSVSAVNYPKTFVCFVIFVVSEISTDNH
jgi:hypothetical protein